MGEDGGGWDNPIHAGMTFSRLRQRCDGLCNFLRRIDPAHATGRNTASIGGASFAFCNPAIAFKGCRTSASGRGRGIARASRS